MAFVCLIACASAAIAQGARIPSDVVDAFHAALRNKDTAGALSMLDRGLVAIIADERGFHGLITRSDLLNHLRRTLV